MMTIAAAITAWRDDSAPGARALAIETRHSERGACDHWWITWPAGEGELDAPAGDPSWTARRLGEFLRLVRLTVARLDPTTLRRLWGLPPCTRVACEFCDGLSRRLTLQITCPTMPREPKLLHDAIYGWAESTAMANPIFAAAMGALEAALVQDTDKGPSSVHLELLAVLAARGLDDRGLAPYLADLDELLQATDRTPLTAPWRLSRAIVDGSDVDLPMASYDRILRRLAQTQTLELSVGRLRKYYPLSTENPWTWLVGAEDGGNNALDSAAVSRIAHLTLSPHGLEDHASVFTSLCRMFADNSSGLRELEINWDLAEEPSQRREQLLALGHALFAATAQLHLESLTLQLGHDVTDEDWRVLCQRHDTRTETELPTFPTLKLLLPAVVDISTFRDLMKALGSSTRNMEFSYGSSPLSMSQLWVLREECPHLESLQVQVIADEHPENATAAPSPRTPSSMKQLIVTVSDPSQDNEEPRTAALASCLRQALSILTGENLRDLQILEPPIANGSRVLETIIKTSPKLKSLAFTAADTGVIETLTALYADDRCRIQSLWVWEPNSYESFFTMAPLLKAVADPGHPVSKYLDSLAIDTRVSEELWPGLEAAAVQVLTQNTRLRRLELHAGGFHPRDSPAIEAFNNQRITSRAYLPSMRRRLALLSGLNTVKLSMPPEVVHLILEFGGRPMWRFAGK